jgi:integrase
MMLDVRTYYDENDITLPKTFRRNKRTDRKNILYTDLPTMKEIKELIEYADKTFKAIILLGVSSGMGRAEICSLTFKHYMDAMGIEPYPETLQKLIDRVGEMGDLVLIRI